MLSETLKKTEDHTGYESSSSNGGVWFHDDGKPKWGPRLSPTSAQRLHLTTLLWGCFNSKCLSPRHLISSTLDHRLSVPIRASGSFYFHVVPISPDHEGATVCGWCSLGPWWRLLSGLESPLGVRAVLWQPNGARNCGAVEWRGGRTTEVNVSTDTFSRFVAT